MGKKTKKRNQTKRVNIDQKVSSFLSKLGIKKSENQYKENWRDILQKEGIDADDLMKNTDAFSVARHNFYFTNKEVALQILTLDYKRFIKVIKSFSELNGFPEKPQSICEIGSGPGIISLWLAMQYPESCITAVDHAENPLKLGNEFSDDLGVKNINFEQASYEDIASGQRDEKFDFIFGSAFLDLTLPCPTDFSSLKKLKDFNADLLPEKDLKPINTFMEACKNIISEEGLLYLDIRSQNEFGLLALLNAARENDLGIDWTCTTAFKETKNCETQYDIGSIHLFLRPNTPSFMESAWEDWIALMLVAEMGDKPITLTPVKFETYFELLSTGLKIMDVDLTIDGHVKENASIYINSGMVGFFRRSEKFGNSGIVHTAGAIYDILAQVYPYIGQGENVEMKYWHPLLLDK